MFHFSSSVCECVCFVHICSKKAGATRYARMVAIVRAICMYKKKMQKKQPPNSFEWLHKKHMACTVYILYNITQHSKAHSIDFVYDFIHKQLCSNFQVKGDGKSEREREGKKSCTTQIHRASNDNNSKTLAPDNRLVKNMHEMQ